MGMGSMVMLHEDLYSALDRFSLRLRLRHLRYFFRPKFKRQSSLYVDIYNTVDLVGA